MFEGAKSFFGKNHDRNDSEIVDAEFLTELQAGDLLNDVLNDWAPNAGIPTEGDLLDVFVKLGITKDDVNEILTLASFPSKDAETKDSMSESLKKKLGLN